MSRKNRCLSQACFVEPVKSGNGLHLFGGENQEKGADCPNCKLPLVQFMRLDTSDPLLEFPEENLKHISLLHCPRCAAFLEDMSYRVGTDGIELVHLAEGTEAWLMKEWLEQFPSGTLTPMLCALKPLPASVQAVFDKANKYDSSSLSEREEALVASYTGHYANPEVGSYPIFDTINQVGGRPYLPQGYLEPLCPTCNAKGEQREMTFLACLTNDDRHYVKILHSECYLTFFLCLHCLTITASQYAE